MRHAFLAAAVVMTAVAAGPAQAAPRTVTVTIDKLKFGAVPGDLHAGDTIVWVNQDIFKHTATARDGTFNVDIPPGKSGKTVLRKAGTIAFYCKYHPGMTGTVSVDR